MSNTTLQVFTLVHVVISLVGIGSGFVILYGLLKAKLFSGWTKLFLATTVLTSASGFGFPFERLLPSHIVGIISLVLLAVAMYALYARRLDGGWRKTYVFNAMASLYLNVFVLIVQSFLKVPALKTLAPTQSEPPFKVTQGVGLLFFIVITIVAAKRFRPELMRAA